MSEKDKQSEFCARLSQLKKISFKSYIQISLNESSFDLFDDGDYFNDPISSQIDKYFNLVCEKREIINENVHSNLIKLNIVKYIYPIILIFGLLGNVISLAVMIRIYRRKKHSYKFSFNLAALSIADLAVLIFGCFREYSDDILDWRLRSRSAILCKMIYFNCYLFSCFSAYLHAFISVERWYAIANPIRFKTGTPRNKRIICALFIICVFISSPLTFFAGIKELVSFNKQNSIDIKMFKECQLSMNNHFFDLILAIADFILVCSIPFLITFLFSMFSLVRLFKTNNAQGEEIPLERCRSRCNLNSTQNLIHHKVNAETKSLKNVSILDLTLKNSSFKRSTLSLVEGNFINSNLSANLKITMMLLALPISYLITTLPIFIIIIIHFHQFSNNSSSDYETEMIIAKTVMYVNNSINILFYIFLGKSLRKDFLKLLPRVLKK